MFVCVQDLQRSVNKLCVRLMPWHPGDGHTAEGAKVEDMMLLVEAMLESTAAEEEQVHLYSAFILISQQ